MTDNLFSKPRYNKKEYLIVFGDPDKFLEYARVPPSHSLKIIPFAEKLKKQTNATGDTLTEILIESQRQSMIFLFGFFKDFEAMKQACDKDPGVFMMEDLDDLDDDDCGEEGGIGYRVFGVGRELYTVEMDIPQAAAGHEIDNMRFPDNWEISKAPLLLRTGEVKSVDRGFSGMLDKRVLDASIFKWAKERNLEMIHEALANLPHVNMTTVYLLNTEALQADPNAPFTVYIKKAVKESRPTLRTV